MFSGFKQRRPYAAVFITLIFSPVIGMAYLNRGRWALGYIVISILMVSAMVVPGQRGYIPLNKDYIITYPLLLLNVVSAPHVWFIARKRSATERLQWYSRWYAIVAIFIVFELGAVAFRHYAYEPFHLPSDAMSPTLNAGDYFFAKKLAYLQHPPARGDVVVFRTERGQFVRRIIGLPGESVQLMDGIVYINGSAIVRQQVENFDLHGQMVAQFVETLPNGRSYRVLDGGLDTMVPKNVPPQHYFVLSDNRDQLIDSHTEGFGLIDASTIVGEATEAVLNNVKF